MKAVNGCLSVIIMTVFCFTSLFSQRCPTTNAIGGKVFVDFNFNGLDDDTAGYIPPITVTAYSSEGFMIEQTTTTSSGNYVLAVPNGTAVRLEFTDIPLGYTDGATGSQSVTSTRMVVSPNCQVHFGMAMADCMCENDPPIIIPCYVNGDPLAGSVGQRDALVMFGYDQRGNGANYASLPPTPGNGGMGTPLGTAAQVGAVWGVSWDKKSKTAFTSAVLKRFSGFGPLGLAGIYTVADPEGAKTLSQYVDLAPCLAIPALPRPDLAGTLFVPSFDVEAYNGAGKKGLGGISISADGLYLYTIDLTNKQLVQVKLRNQLDGPLLSGSCSNVSTFAIPPIPSCTGSDNRPWAVKTHNGKVYVGVVCSAETSGVAADMTTQIFIFDPVTSIWTNVFISPQSLNYTTKGCAVGLLGAGLCCQWYPWLRTDTYVYEGVNPEGFVCYSQPILSDLEFDADGSIIMGFMDRFGLQIGWQNGHDPSKNQFFSGMAGGDILYAYNDKVNSQYVFNTGANILDANGNIIKSGCSRDGEYGIEFYCADNVAGNHFEGFNGGLALQKVNNNLIGTFVDPGLALGSNQVNAGGIQHINNASGSMTDYYSVYYNGGNLTYGKAVGVGDITLMCEVPPLQIGNVVWEDVNKNGIQDPSEPLLSGINIDLYNSSGTLIGSTVSDANGQYYFNSTTTPALTEQADYFIVIRDYQQLTGLNGTGLLLTSPNVGIVDIRDSDGVTDGASGIAAIGSKPYIKVATGLYGENNFSYDFGFSSEKCDILKHTVKTVECNGDGSVDILISFEWVNATIGDQFSINVNGSIKMLTATAIDGTGQVVFSVFSGLSNFNIEIQNTTTPACSVSTTYNTLSTTVSIASVTVGNCVFDPVSLQSTAIVSVNVSWTGLVVNDVLKATLNNKTLTYTVTSVSGVRTFNFIEPADGTTGHSVSVEVVDKCQKSVSTYAVPASCPSCIVKVNSVIHGECTYNSGSGNSFAPMSVEVYWFTPSFPTTINVTANGQTIPVVVNTMQGTSTVEFLNTPANGSTGNIVSTVFANNAGCNNSFTYSAPNPCPVTRDLALEKSVSPSQLQVGQTAVWTIKVKHQGDLTATGVSVKDVLPVGVTYSGVHTASMGTFDGSIWTIGTLNTGVEVSLQISTVVAQAGVFYNTAEINTMNENDNDSTPNNNVESEDDYDIACVSAPFKICEGESITLNVGPGSYNILWYKNGVLIPGEVGTFITVTTPGTYTFTSTSNAGGGRVLDCCCPVVVEPGPCPCTLNIKDIDVVTCVDNPGATSTTATICVEWTGAGTNATLNLNVSGAQTGSVNTPLTGQASFGTHCFDVPVALNESITATITSGACTQDVKLFNSPMLCPFCAINITSVSAPSVCNYDAGSMSSMFTYTVNVGWSGLQVGEVINLTASGTNQLYIVPSAAGNFSFSVLGLATGSSQNIIVSHGQDQTCSASAVVQSPEPCGPANCTLKLNVTTGICTDNAVEIVANTTWTGAGVGDILTVTAGGNTQTSAPLTAGNAGNGGASYSFNLAAPVSGNVTASLSGCSSQKSFSVNGCAACALNITSITPGPCVYNAASMKNEFSVVVCVDWANAFGGDVLHAQLGDQILTPTQQGIYYIHDNKSGSHCFTLTALADDTQDLDVKAFFSVTACSETQVDVVDSPDCCLIDNIFIVHAECLNNNTPNKHSDNKIYVGIQATNTNAALTTYQVTVSGGTTITPTTGTYGVPTYFTLGSGSGGGGSTFTISLTDSLNPACVKTIQVVDPGNCLNSIPCPPIQCGSSTIQVNGN